MSADIRASDSDRDRVAKLLQDHFAKGRLDSDEFNSRLETAYTARTHGELVPLTADLPERDLADLPAEQARAAQHTMSRAAMLRDPMLVAPWLLWAGVNAVCFTVWLIIYLTHAAGSMSTYPWFLWVLGPWGVVMLFVTLGVVLTGSRGARGD